jgi:hypothetical protein
MSTDLNNMRENYDWREAFRYASFEFDDVASIIATDEGENDGRNWLAVGTLKDGQFFILSAGCDYTGWDCQAGGQSEVADTLDNLIRWRLGEEDRERLGFKLPPETDGAPLPEISHD